MLLAGSTDEVCVLEMVGEGLVAVPNASAAFLSQRPMDGSPGVSGAVTVIMQGTRPMLLEVQVGLFSQHSVNIQSTFS
jgi:DNA repair protein RadA/Sms